MNGETFGSSEYSDDGPEIRALTLTVEEAIDVARDVIREFDPDSDEDVKAAVAARDQLEDLKNDDMYNQLDRNTQNDIEDLIEQFDDLTTTDPTEQ